MTNTIKSNGSSIVNNTPNGIVILSPLMQAIQYKEQTYFTSQYFHSQYKANAGDKYQNLSDFNALIRSIRAYPIYVQTGDIVELIWAEVKEITDGNLPSVMKSNAYRPIMLINATAQIALTHHLDDEISKEVSVAVNTKAATKVIKEKSVSFLSREFKGALAIAHLMGFEGNQAMLSANQGMKSFHGVDMHKQFGFTLVAPSKESLLTATELGLKMGMSAIKVNLLLEDNGYIQSYVTTKGAKAWALTETGRPFAELLDTGKRHGNGTPVQQIKWYGNVVEFLVSK
jgi:hypothetical protein